MRSGLLSKAKGRILRDDVRQRTIPLGLYKGLRFDINLAHQSQLYFGLWERETYRAISRALQTAQWAVDVGAGRGELALLAATYPSIKAVVAIEPDAGEAAMLRGNMRMNGVSADRLQIIERPAGDGDGMVRLDDLGLTGRGFLKIDVDGFEMDVLRSGPNLLAGNVDLLIETHSAELEQQCLEMLNKHLGYSCRIITNAWWRSIFPEQRPLEHNRWLVASR